MTKKDTTGIGYKYEKYISDYFVKHGYDWVTADLHPSFNSKKIEDVMNIDGLHVECKWHEQTRMAEYFDQAKRQAKAIDFEKKKSQDCNNAITVGYNINYGTELKLKGYDKPPMPVVFHKIRKDGEEYPDPNTEDYVIMRLEDWIELYKAYQEKEYKEDFKINADSMEVFR